MTATRIRVAVAGAGGRMGQEVVKMVLGEPDFELVSAVSPSHGGRDAGELVGQSPCGVRIEEHLERALWPRYVGTGATYGVLDCPELFDRRIAHDALCP